MGKSSSGRSRAGSEVSSRSQRRRTSTGGDGDDVETPSRTRSRPDATTSSSSSRRKSSKREDDDRDDEFAPRTSRRSMSSQDPYVNATATATAPSSYATAIEGDGDRRRRDDDSARESRKESRRESSKATSRTEEVRALDDEYTSRRRDSARKDSDREHRRDSKRDSAYSTSSRTTAERSERKSTTSRGIEDHDAVLPQNQFPGAFPETYDKPYRPPGHAADYYGDQGESVSAQPGVRPQPPSFYQSAEQAHLYTPSTESKPPPEPSSLGQTGASASYFVSDVEDNAPVQPVTPSRPSKTTHPGAFPSDSPQMSSGSANQILSSNHAGAMTGLGAAVAAGAGAGAVADYLTGPSPSQSTSQQHHNSSFNDQHQQSFQAHTSQSYSQRPSQADSRPPWQSYGYTSSSTSKPSRPEASFNGLGVAGTAAAAGLAGAAAVNYYGQHHQNHQQHQSTHSHVHRPSSQSHGAHSGFAGSSMQQQQLKHRQRGPLTKLADWFRDPQGVAQFEQYTEAIGVCKYCFDPNSSPADAPRPHHYDRAKHDPHLHRVSSSGRVKKSYRYTSSSSSSDDERRKKSSATTKLIGGGLAAYGATKVGEAMLKRNHDFEDTYSVKSGQPLTSVQAGPGYSQHQHRDSNVYTGERKSNVTRYEYSHDSGLQRRDSASSRRTRRDEVQSGKHSSRRRSSSSSSAGLSKGAAIAGAAGVAALAAANRRRSRSRSRSKERVRRKKSYYSKRISPRHSYVDLNAKTTNGASGFGAFFSSPSANEKKGKRSKGLFTWKNDSSSSSDADLAFGEGTVLRKTSKKDKGRRPSSPSRNGDMTAILGLAAAGAALAAEGDRRKSKSKRDTADSHHIGPHQSSRRLSSNKISLNDREHAKPNDDDGAWEDASDDDDSSSDSIDTALAYGGRLSARTSRESLADQGTSKWAWRWNKNKDKPRPKDRRQSETFRPTVPQPHEPYGRTSSAAFGAAAAAAGVAAASAMSQQSSPLPPMKFVEPFPVSTPNLYEARQVSLANDGPSPHTIVSRSPAPLQQPSAVNAPIVAPMPTVLSKLEADARLVDSPTEILYGGDRERPALQRNRSDSNERVRPKRRNSSPILVNPSNLSRNSVSWALTQEQLENERKAHEKQERRRRRQAEEDRRASADFSTPRTPEKEITRTEPASESRRDILAKHEARTAEIEKELQALYAQRKHAEETKKRDDPKRRDSGMGVAGAAIAAAGVGAAAAAIMAESKKSSGSDSDKIPHRKSSLKKKSTDTIPEVGAPVTRSSSPPRDPTPQKESQQARIARMAAQRAKTTPVHEDYAQHFVPTEIAAHVDEHNNASEQRHKPKEQRRERGAPNVITIVPDDFDDSDDQSKFDPINYQPYGTSREHLPRYHPRGVPVLDLTVPTPPGSRSASAQRDRAPSPLSRNEPESRSDDKPTSTEADYVTDDRRSRADSTSSKVNWGSNSTHVFEVQTPEHERTDPTADLAQTRDGDRRDPPVSRKEQAIPPVEDMTREQREHVSMGKDFGDLPSSDGKKTTIEPLFEDRSPDPSPMTEPSLKELLGDGSSYQRPFFESVSDMGEVLIGDDKHRDIPKTGPGFVEVQSLPESPVQERKSAVLVDSNDSPKDDNAVFDESVAETRPSRIGRRRMERAMSSSENVTPTIKPSDPVPTIVEQHEPENAAHEIAPTSTEREPSMPGGFGVFDFLVDEDGKAMSPEANREFEAAVATALSRRSQGSSSPESSKRAAKIASSATATQKELPAASPAPYEAATYVAEPPVVPSWYDHPSVDYVVGSQGPASIPSQQPFPIAYSHPDVMHPQPYFYPDQTQVYQDPQVTSWQTQPAYFPGPVGEAAAYEHNSKSGSGYASDPDMSERVRNKKQKQPEAKATSKSEIGSGAREAMAIAAAGAAAVAAGAALAKKNRSLEKDDSTAANGEPDVYAPASTEKKKKRKSKRESEIFDEFDGKSTISTPITKDEDKKSRRRSKRESELLEDDIKSATSVPTTKGEEDKTFRRSKRDADNIDDRDKTSGKDEEGESRRRSKRSSEGFYGTDAKSTTSLADTQDDEDRSKRRSKRASDMFDDYDNKSTTSLPAVQDEDRKSRRRSKRDSEIFDDDDAKSIVSMPATRDEDRKSKRRSRHDDDVYRDDDDTRSVMSTSTEKRRSKDRDREKDKDKDGEKDKKSTGFFANLFSKEKSDVSSSSKKSSKSVKSESRAERDGSRERERRKKRRSKSIDEYDDVKSVASEPARSSRYRSSSRDKKDATAFIDESRNISVDDGFVSADDGERNGHQHNDNEDQSFLGKSLEMPQPTVMDMPMGTDGVSGPSTERLTSGVEPLELREVTSDRESTAVAEEARLPPLPEQGEEELAILDSSSVPMMTPTFDRTRRLSNLRIGGTDSSPALPSPTAIPLNFGKRSSFTPGQRPPGSPVIASPLSTPRTRMQRPKSSSGKDFKPLYLVERHNAPKTPQFEPEERLPSLPSSRSSSTHTSVEDLPRRTHEQEAVPSSPERGRRHSFSSVGESERRRPSPEYLDSRAATPVPGERQRARDNELDEIRLRRAKEQQWKALFHSPSELLQDPALHPDTNEEIQEEPRAPSPLPSVISTDHEQEFMSAESRPQSPYTERDRFSEHQSREGSRSRDRSRRDTAVMTGVSIAGGLLAGVAAHELLKRRSGDDVAVDSESEDQAVPVRATSEIRDPSYAAREFENNARSHESSGPPDAIAGDTSPDMIDEAKPLEAEPGFVSAKDKNTKKSKKKAKGKGKASEQALPELDTSTAVRASSNVEEVEPTTAVPSVGVVLPFSDEDASVSERAIGQATDFTLADPNVDKFQSSTVKLPQVKSQSMIPNEQRILDSLTGTEHSMPVFDTIDETEDQLGAFEQAFERAVRARGLSDSTSRAEALEAFLPQRDNAPFVPNSGLSPVLEASPAYTATPTSEVENTNAEVSSVATPVIGTASKKKAKKAAKKRGTQNSAAPDDALSQPEPDEKAKSIDQSENVSVSPADKNPFGNDFEIPPETTISTVTRQDLDDPSVDKDTSVDDLALKPLQLTAEPTREERDQAPASETISPAPVNPEQDADETPIEISSTKEKKKKKKKKSVTTVAEYADLTNDSVSLESSADASQEDTKISSDFLNKDDVYQSIRQSEPVEPIEKAPTTNEEPSPVAVADDFEPVLTSRKESKKKRKSRLSAAIDLDDTTEPFQEPTTDTKNEPLSKAFVEGTTPDEHVQSQSTNRFSDDGNEAIEKGRESFNFTDAAATAAAVVVGAAGGITAAQVLASKKDQPHNNELVTELEASQSTEHVKDLPSSEKMLGSAEQSLPNTELQSSENIAAPDVEDDFVPATDKKSKKKKKKNRSSTIDLSKVDNIQDSPISTPPTESAQRTLPEPATQEAEGLVEPAPILETPVEQQPDAVTKAVDVNDTQVVMEPQGQVENVEPDDEWALSSSSKKSKKDKKKKKQSILLTEAPQTSVSDDTVMPLGRGVVDSSPITSRDLDTITDAPQPSSEATQGTDRPTELTAGVASEEQSPGLAQKDLPMPLSRKASKKDKKKKKEIFTLEPEKAEEPLSETATGLENPVELRERTPDEPQVVTEHGVTTEASIAKSVLPTEEHLETVDPSVKMVEEKSSGLASMTQDRDVELETPAATSSIAETAPKKSKKKKKTVDTPVLVAPSAPANPFAPDITLSDALKLSMGQTAAALAATNAQRTKKQAVGAGSSWTTWSPTPSVIESEQDARAVSPPSQEMPLLREGQDIDIATGPSEALSAPSDGMVRQERDVDANNPAEALSIQVTAPTDEMTRDFVPDTSVHNVSASPDNVHEAPSPRQDELADMHVRDNELEPSENNTNIPRHQDKKTLKSIITTDEDENLDISNHGTDRGMDHVDDQDISSPLVPPTIDAERPTSLQEAQVVEPGDSSEIQSKAPSEAQPETELEDSSFSTAKSTKKDKKDKKKKRKSVATFEDPSESASQEQVSEDVADVTSPEQIEPLPLTEEPSAIVDVPEQTMPDGDRELQTSQAADEGDLQLSTASKKSKKDKKKKRKSTADILDSAVPAEKSLADVVEPVQADETTLQPESSTRDTAAELPLTEPLELSSAPTEAPEPSVEDEWSLPTKSSKKDKKKKKKSGSTTPAVEQELSTEVIGTPLESETQAEDKAIGGVDDEIVEAPSVIDTHAEEKETTPSIPPSDAVEDPEWAMPAQPKKKGKKKNKSGTATPAAEPEVQDETVKNAFAENGASEPSSLKEHESSAGELALAAGAAALVSTAVAAGMVKATESDQAKEAASPVLTETEPQVADATVGAGPDQDLTDRDIAADDVFEDALDQQDSVDPVPEASAEIVANIDDMQAEDISSAATKPSKKEKKKKKKDKAITSGPDPVELETQNQPADTLEGALTQTDDAITKAENEPVLEPGLHEPVPEDIVTEAEAHRDSSEPLLTEEPELLVEDNDSNYVVKPMKKDKKKKKKKSESSIATAADEPVVEDPLADVISEPLAEVEATAESLPENVPLDGGAQAVDDSTPEQSKDSALETPGESDWAPIKLTKKDKKKKNKKSISNIAVDDPLPEPVVEQGDIVTLDETRSVPEQHEMTQEQNDKADAIETLQEIPDNSDKPTESLSNAADLEQPTVSTVPGLSSPGIVDKIVDPESRQEADADDWMFAPTPSKKSKKKKKRSDSTVLSETTSGNATPITGETNRDAEKVNLTDVLAEEKSGDEVLEEQDPAITSMSLNEDLQALPLISGAGGLTTATASDERDKNLSAAAPISAEANKTTPIEGGQLSLDQDLGATPDVDVRQTITVAPMPDDPADQSNQGVVPDDSPRDLSAQTGQEDDDEWAFTSKPAKKDKKKKKRKSGTSTPAETSLSLSVPETEPEVEPIAEEVSKIQQIDNPIRELGEEPATVPALENALPQPDVRDDGHASTRAQSQTAIEVAETNDLANIDGTAPTTIPATVDLPSQHVPLVEKEISAIKDRSPTELHEEPKHQDWLSGAFKSAEEFPPKPVTEDDLKDRGNVHDAFQEQTPIDTLDVADAASNIVTPATIGTEPEETPQLSRKSKKDKKGKKKRESTTSDDGHSAAQAAALGTSAAITGAAAAADFNQTKEDSEDISSAAAKLTRDAPEGDEDASKHSYWSSESDNLPNQPPFPEEEIDTWADADVPQAAKDDHVDTNVDDLFEEQPRNKDEDVSWVKGGKKVKKGKKGKRDSISISPAPTVETTDRPPHDLQIVPDTEASSGNAADDDNSTSVSAFATPAETPFNEAGGFPWPSALKTSKKDKKKRKSVTWSDADTSTPVTPANERSDDLALERSIEVLPSDTISDEPESIVEVADQPVMVQEARQERQQPATNTITDVSTLPVDTATDNSQEVTEALTPPSDVATAGTEQEEFSWESSTTKKKNKKDKKKKRGIATETDTPPLPQSEEDHRILKESNPTTTTLEAHPTPSSFDDKEHADLSAAEPDVPAAVIQSTIEATTDNVSVLDPMISEERAGPVDKAISGDLEVEANARQADLGFPIKSKKGKKKNKRGSSMMDSEESSPLAKKVETEDDFVQAHTEEGSTKMDFTESKEGIEDPAAASAEPETHVFESQHNSSDQPQHSAEQADPVSETVTDNEVGLITPMAEADDELAFPTKLSKKDKKKKKHESKISGTESIATGVLAAAAVIAAGSFSSAQNDDVDMDPPDSATAPEGQREIQLSDDVEIAGAAEPHVSTQQSEPTSTAVTEDEWSIGTKKSKKDKKKKKKSSMAEDIPTTQELAQEVVQEPVQEALRDTTRELVEESRPEDLLEHSEMTTPVVPEPRAVTADLEQAATNDLETSNKNTTRDIVQDLVANESFDVPSSMQTADLGPQDVGIEEALLTTSSSSKKKDKKKKKRSSTFEDSEPASSASVLDELAPVAPATEKEIPSSEEKTANTRDLPDSAVVDLSSLQPLPTSELEPIPVIEPQDLEPKQIIERPAEEEEEDFWKVPSKKSKKDKKKGKKGAVSQATSADASGVQTPDETIVVGAEAEGIDSERQLPMDVDIPRTGIELEKRAASPLLAADRMDLGLAEDLLTSSSAAGQSSADAAAERQDIDLPDIVEERAIDSSFKSNQDVLAETDQAANADDVVVFTTKSSKEKKKKKKKGKSAVIEEDAPSSEPVDDTFDPISADRSAVLINKPEDLPSYQAVSAKELHEHPTHQGFLAGALAAATIFPPKPEVVPHDGEAADADKAMLEPTPLVAQPEPSVDEDFTFTRKKSKKGKKGEKNGSLSASSETVSVTPATKEESSAIASPRDILSPESMAINAETIPESAQSTSFGAGEPHEDVFQPQDADMDPVNDSDTGSNISEATRERRRRRRSPPLRHDYDPEDLPRDRALTPPPDHDDIMDTALTIAAGLGFGEQQNDHAEAESFGANTARAIQQDRPGWSFNNIVVDAPELVSEHNRDSGVQFDSPTAAQTHGTVRDSGFAPSPTLTDRLEEIVREQSIADDHDERPQSKLPNSSSEDMKAHARSIQHDTESKTREGLLVTPARRQPTPVDPASKERSSVLFNSSPAMSTPRTPHSQRKLAQESRDLPTPVPASQGSPSIFSQQRDSGDDVSRTSNSPKARRLSSDLASNLIDRAAASGVNRASFSPSPKHERERSLSPTKTLDTIHEGDSFPLGAAAAAAALGLGAVALTSSRDDPTSRSRSLGKSKSRTNSSRDLRGSAESLFDPANPDIKPPRTPVNVPSDVAGAPRERGMAEVYDGFGSFPGSPMSPTRPPSMRRRQSMQQIRDLETRVDQLASENRMLAEAKLAAEQHLEEFQLHGAGSEQAAEALQSANLQLQARDQEIFKLRAEIAALAASHTTLKGEHEQKQAQWQNTSRELDGLRSQHQELALSIDNSLKRQLDSALSEKDADIQRLKLELENARLKIRELQAQILQLRADDIITVRDEDYFEHACQTLCQHVQQWVLRFSKFSDSRVCRRLDEVRDEKTQERFDNAVLDGTDVDHYLSDRVKRRDIFMSVVMTMIWEYVFTRYLFGMDRDQRQKLKQLEKNLADVGPSNAVQQWRALTLTLLSKREAFKQQCDNDTEAVVLEITKTLARFLPPPQNLDRQISESLLKVMKVAVELSIEMRTQRAEYIMLPPLQPEYDTNGDLAHKVYFKANLMNERSGETESNEALQESRAVVRIVLFPLVLKKGDDYGKGDEEVVVCPAQVLVARPDKKRPKSRLASGDYRSVKGASTHSLAMSGVDMTGQGQAQGNMF